MYQAGTHVTAYGNVNCVDSVMQSVTGTSEEEVADYVNALKENGYVLESSSQIEDNLFYRFTRNNQRVSVNYYAGNKNALIIFEPQKGVSATETSYTYEPRDGEDSQFYMFGIKMDPNGMNISAEENTSGYINNGECLIIKCADNSVIIVDGGDTSQMTEADQTRFLTLLRNITGTADDEKITVSAWYITHFHSDHVSGVSRIFNDQPEQFELQRVICNMPNLAAVGQSGNAYFASTKKAIVENYPDCQDIKVHTGDVIQLADVTLTVMYTHEDLAYADGTFTSQSKDFNDTSTVVMVENAAGMRMLVTGDMNVKSEAVLCTNFTTASLKSDILQQPHHNFNNNTTIYEYANAQVMLFTQALGGLTKNDECTTRSEQAKKWCTEWYCGGNETVGFVYEDGKAKLIYQEADIYE